MLHGSRCHHLSEAVLTRFIVAHLPPAPQKSRARNRGPSSWRKTDAGQDRGTARSQVLPGSRYHPRIEVHPGSRYRYTQDRGTPRIEVPPTCQRRCHPGSRYHPLVRGGAAVLRRIEVPQDRGARRMQDAGSRCHPLVRGGPDTVHRRASASGPAEIECLLVVKSKCRLDATIG